MKNVWICGLALFALSCSVAPVVAQDDAVFGTKGTPTRGTIVRTTPNEVVINERGNDRTFPVNEILKVTFADDTAEIRTARDRAIAGQIEEAEDAFSKVDLSAISRGILKQDVQYYLAYCNAKLALTGGGNKEDAGRQMFAFVSANPGSYHYYEANEIIGDLFMALGKYPNAAEYYGKLLAAPFDEYKMKGAVLQARSLVFAGDYQNAMQKYDAVISSNLDNPEAIRQKRFAEIGKAACLAETGNPDQGIQTLQKIINDQDPQDAELFARAYNALGTCYMKMNEPKKALMAFLHTDLLFYQAGDAHAEALYYLSVLWKEARKADRATQARELLTNRYSGTVWASRANN